ncbi:sugar phosphate isomerase/epimerase family protein [Tuwongella immobilis]|uniref:Xylose isomerase-like TIM barrel domain-containing protein n=1 Tax=Tuwongella immobilis TaxID=692036 RepID=A0A6C2YJG2_9BACT|nr:sugar phosphate isomerase/epimerase family protein [Tuwongella immobilis]VIP01379.1 Sugar phosphate isomerase/epimerase OS=Singulisphaera acidiphila (strain ATCC BAA-1392 / DSM 18658 / VKM B-2454 / MOB10) GN=Sinac_6324 PE=4 SV=1: AP_endonuc_2 [Tuwongella immobilis]VTR98230.1 Sugar phosphate isomerase/epimerase OS=Singulisphaera acidiphila (strain ATCC BAA-1392 / DSM 18658 / VKM B-2454 / MOB10) GN=Sinac_6324 PE=4 SV=1: AP_endonuc_2 [Tuwongella immobilis]
MNGLQIGIRAESTGLPLRRAFAEAARAGASGIEVEAVGDILPTRLSETGRREFRHLLRSYNLSLTALNCPLRGTIDEPTGLDTRIAYIQSVMTLAYDLGTRVVIIENGKLPADPQSPRAQLLAESLRGLAAHGDRTGVTLALETGLDGGDVLATFLEKFDTGSLGVNFDTGNMLINGFHPIDHLLPLRKYLVHLHARDIRQGSMNRLAAEVSLGAGSIDWLNLLATLSVIEYTGYVVVDREQGENRLADLLAGVAFLKRISG